MINATICPCARGQIFLLPDIKQKHVGVDNHNYIVMSNRCGDGKNIQCMTITSMTKIQYQGAVPIMMLNHKISYILPFNMYKFFYSDFDLRNYHGSVQDDILSSNDFMTMLNELYLYFNGFDTIHPKEEIIEIYNRYIERFWSVYSHNDEYRLTKIKQAHIDVNTNSLVWGKRYNSRIRESEIVLPTGVMMESKTEDKLSFDTLSKVTIQSKKEETLSVVNIVDTTKEEVMTERPRKVCTNSEMDHPEKKSRGRKPIFDNDARVKIVALYTNGTSIKELSKQYNCSVNTISRIVK